MEAVIKNYMATHLQAPKDKKLNLNAINRKANSTLGETIGSIRCAVDNVRMSGSYTNLWI